MKKLFKVAFFLIFSLSGLHLSAQISITGGQNAQQLAEFLAGPNITVTNAVLTGDSTNASGIFSGTNSDVGFDDGVILSTGDAATAAGPNTTTSTGQDLSEPGTTQMTNLIGAQSFDAITLEFDFEVQSSMIQFKYVFASEEYPEFAPPFNSGFNDAFAFYISGPGITGQENIALVPNTSVIVSSNTINPQNNSQYFVNNPGGQDVEFDGLTTVLTAIMDSLTPCSTYHLKLVIADGEDADYNSAVFLKKNSLVQDLISVQTQTVNQDSIALEGCIKASFSFSYNDVSSVDRTLTYQIGGTAVNGVDYGYIDTILTVPAGDTSATIFIDAFSDGLTEGQESIYIIYQPDICSPDDTAFLFIDDSQPIDYTLGGTDLLCFEDGSGEIQITAAGGFPPYTYHITDSTNTTTQYQTNPITGLAAGQYTVLVEDSYGCFAEALVVGGVFDADTTFLPDGTGVTYDAPLVISGFGAGQTITDVSQIQQICLTMEHSYLGDLEITVESPSGQIIVLKDAIGGGSCDLGEPFASSDIDGQNSNLTDPGVGYEYCFNANPVYGTMVSESSNFTHTIPASTGGTYTDNYLPAGSYTPYGNFSSLVGSTMNGTWTVHVTDNNALDNGYIFNWYISLIGDEPDTTIVLTQPDEMTATAYVQGTACGSNNGSINLSVQSGQSPYTYLWSNGDTTQNISGLAAGLYTVTVTDSNSCQASETFAVNNSGSMSLTYTTTPTSCFGGNDGTIDISPAGGTLPYTFAWNTGDTTQDVTGLTAGNYTVSVTDSLGCIFSEVITINDAPELIVGINSFSNEECNANNGVIDINVLGGNGSYNFSWSNGSIDEDISGLSSGTYTVTVTDGSGCTANVSQTLINDQSDCSAFCYLSVTSNSVMNEQCGDGNGSIDIEILNGSAPLNISWSNGAITEDLDSLEAGTYTVTVTDDNNCSVTETFTVTNNTGSLSVGGVLLSEENCGSGDGSINVTVSGGVTPYDFSWSNGDTIEDIDSLSAGSYTLIVTDSLGCELSTSYTVGNNSGTLSATGLAIDENCTLSNGSINQTTSGGNGDLNYLWSGGQTTQDISGLTAGTYTCTISDEVGCYVTNTYTVNQGSGGITISSSIVTNEVCGNGQGAINIIPVGDSLIFSWSNGDTTEDISGLAAGNYTCTITDTAGCTYVSNPISVLNSSGSLLVGTPLVTDEMCTNGLGAINMTVSYGTSPYSFLWSNGDTTEDVSGLSAGSYNVVVTDSVGCSETHSITVSNSPGTLTVQSTLTNEVCGNDMGAINLTTSGGSGSYNYQWSNNSITEDINGLSAGTYTVIVSDTANCELTETYVLNNDAQSLSIASASVSNELCGSGNGSISLTINGGNGPHSFAWSNGAVSQNVSGLSAGTYQVTITDDDLCSVTGSYTISNDPGGLSVSSISTAEVCGDTTGAIDITITNGTFPMIFNWDSGDTIPDITGLSAGIYTLTLSDNFGCQVIHTDTVTNTTTGLSVSIASIVNDSCGSGSGAIDAIVTGNGPFIYQWSSGQTTEDLSGLSAGNYTLTVTDSITGCSESVTGIVINQANTLAISFDNVGHENCANAQGFVDIEISGSGQFFYAWSTGDTTQDITGLSAGVYTVTVSDTNGCQLTASYTVNNNNTSNLTANNSVISNAFCTSNNGAIDLVVTGGIGAYSFLWSSGDTTEDVSGLAPGNYTVTVTDGATCTYTNTWTISTEMSNLDITSINVIGAFCGDSTGQITVNSSTADNYYLDSVLSTGTPANEFLNLSGGTYLVSVSDAYGCTLDSNVMVNNAAFFGVSYTQVDDSCGMSLGSIDITTQSYGDPVTYLWSNGATSEDLTGLSAGTYTVTITVTLGLGFTCSSDYTITINNISPFSITGVITDENCGDGQGAIDQILVTGSGVSYLWSNGETTQDLFDLTEGTYTCIASLGVCVDTLDYVVENIVGSLASSAIIYSDTCSSEVGVIDFSVTGGSGSFGYLWSNNAITQDIDGLEVNTYTVTTTDLADNCTLIDSFQVSNIDVSFGAIGVVTHASGPATTDGEIDITMGGIGNYIFNWSNGETTEDISNLVTGTYVLEIASGQDCDTTLTFFVGDLLEIEENDFADIKMTIMPNPAIYQFTIKYELPDETQGSILITDGLGRVVRRDQISGTNQFVVDASNMSSGLYFVTLRTNQVNHTERVMITH